MFFSININTSSLGFVFIFILKNFIIIESLNFTMTLKKIGGKLFLVNLLSDFILSKIGHDEDSIIKVIDCENFFVLKGKTSSKDVLFMPNLISEFKEKFNSLIPETKLTHTIDLIEYDKSIAEVTEISHTYYNNTPNCSYHYEDVDKFEDLEEKDEMVYVSNFPHGHSLSQGRLLYYYGKKIFYNIPSTYPITTLTLTISNNKNEDGDYNFRVFDEFFKSEDEILRSAVLDVFDFNMTTLSNEIKKVDWSIELTNPLSEYDFLKEKVGDLIII